MFTNITLDRLSWSAADPLKCFTNGQATVDQWLTHGQPMVIQWLLIEIDGLMWYM